MKLVFVSAGMISPKKGASRIHRRHQYLNYGLMSLANSPAVEPGSIYHGGFDSPGVTAVRIAEKISLSESVLFLVSCPSFLALDWTHQFLEAARRMLPKSIFVVGGRWVVDGNVDRLREILPLADYLVEGLAEGILGRLIEEISGLPYVRSRYAATVFEEAGLSYLDYSKLDGSTLFVPSFEVSRGCGAGCAFCSEANVALTRMKPAATLCAEIADYRQSVEQPVDRYYLETSLFTPRFDWIEALIAERDARHLSQVSWRTEARVDMFTPRAIERLGYSGLRILDLGLESASPDQLTRMNKSKVPIEYLRKCETLLRSAHDAGIMTKINILLFPGETLGTLEQTEAWLDRNRSYITGVSVYPAVYYGFSPEQDPTWAYYLSLGGSRARTLGNGGITMMNLSPEIDADAAEEHSTRIARDSMDAIAYFKLKSFSYFDPTYTFEEFRADVLADFAGLAFRVPSDWRLAP